MKNWEVVFYQKVAVALHICIYGAIIFLMKKVEGRMYHQLNHDICFFTPLTEEENDF